ncbi:MAG: hypothetical protein GWN58_58535 [Anaerolineae bacterium]|nr:hypothetical protein [Anaerolineae bacterium]
MLEKIMFMPDAHLPYHDETALSVFLNAAAEYRPDHLFILGDLLDFYAVSRHDKDPGRRLTLQEEVESSLEVLDRIESLGVPHVTFCAGNHENRLERYIATQAPELFGLVSVEELLGIARRGWDYVPYRQCAKLGKLYVTHDVGYSGQRVCAQTMAAVNVNMVVGHAHRIQYTVERDIMGGSHVAMCPGWLGDFSRVDYMHTARMKSWAHGFGMGIVEPETGVVHVYPVAIVDGWCPVAGKKVTA